MTDIKETTPQDTLAEFAAQSVLFTRIGHGADVAKSMLTKADTAPFVIEQAFDATKNDLTDMAKVQDAKTEFLKGLDYN